MACGGGAVLQGWLPGRGYAHRRRLTSPERVRRTRRESKLGCYVDAEFVVAAAEVLHERVPGGDQCGGGEAFQPAHRPQPSLAPVVIGFHPVVAEALRHVPSRRQQRSACTRRTGVITNWPLRMLSGFVVRGRSGLVAS